MRMDAKTRNRITSDALHWLTTHDTANYLLKLGNQRRHVSLNVFADRELDAWPAGENRVNVSSALLETFDTDELEWVLIHELCHLMVPKDYLLHQWTHEIIYDSFAWLWFDKLGIDTGKILSAMKRLPDRSDGWHCKPKDRSVILVEVMRQFPPVHNTY